MNSEPLNRPIDKFCLVLWNVRLGIAKKEMIFLLLISLIICTPDRQNEYGEIYKKLQGKIGFDSFSV